MPREEPQDLEAEKALLGAMLISKDRCADALDKLQEDDFYLISHQHLFHCIKYLNEQKMPIEITTVTSYLKDHELIDKIGGVEYLMVLTDSIATVAHTPYYIDRLLSKSMLRRIIKETSIITGEAYDEVEDIPGFLAQVETRIMAVTKDRAAGEFKVVHDVIREVRDELTALASSNSRINGVDTGFIDLDKLTLGLQPGALIIIAARPAMGKTAFALNIAHHAAYNAEKPVAVFSLEMDAGALVKRILGSMGEIRGDDIKTGDIMKKEPQRFYAAADKVNKCNLYMDDTGGITINDISAKCRQLRSRHNGLKLIIIDYLQLITGSSKNRENRQQEVSEISRQLKGLARELEVPIIALSQLSRTVEQRPDKRPMLSDLRESGAIEQDADMVSFIYREGYYKKVEEQGDDNGVTEVIVAKHRNGPTGTVNLVFQKDFSRFSNMTPVGPDGSGPGVRDIRT